MQRFFWKVLVKPLVIAVCILAALRLTTGAPAHASACGSPCFFWFQATSSNTTGYITHITNDQGTNLNASPGAQLQVMQEYVGTYDAHPLGVWYDYMAQEWTIFNEDRSPMPIGTYFAITIDGGDPNWNGSTWDYTQVTATANNTSGDFVRIDDPVTNNNPAALVFVTQDWTGTYDTSQVGAYYDSSSSKWTVFNEDQTPIPIGATFNLALENNKGSYTQVDQATSSNTQGYITFLSGVTFIPLQITQVYNPNGVCGCNFNNHPIGYWYDHDKYFGSGPTVFNVDKSPMTIGAAFFVMGQ